MARLYTPYEGPIVKRADAQAIGAKRYFDGSACPSGHISQRYAGCGRCSECLHLTSRRYQLACDPAVLSLRTNKWARENPEKARASGVRWELANKDKRRQFNSALRATRKCAEGSHTLAELNGLIKLQKSKCANCKVSVKSGYHVDHIKPLSRGGSNYIKNIQILCPTCNLKKHARDPIVWAQLNGRLL